MLTLYVQFSFKHSYKNTTKTIHTDTVATKGWRKFLTARVKELSDQFRTIELKGDFTREYKHLRIKYWSSEAETRGNAWKLKTEKFILEIELIYIFQQ